MSEKVPQAPDVQIDDSTYRRVASLRQSRLSAHVATCEYPISASPVHNSISGCDEMRVLCLFMAPLLTVLGVFRLDVTRKVFAAQLPMYGDEAQCRDHFSSVVLIEALIDGHDERFDLGGFWQPNLGDPHGSRQAPWDEGLLSSDGEKLLARRNNCVKGTGPLRFAFYLHYWNPQQPLHWTYGEVACPAPQRMPTRLKRLMPYRPCD